jgi:hypothetical protein
VFSAGSVPGGYKKDSEDRLNQTSIGVPIEQLVES